MNYENTKTDVERLVKACRTVIRQREHGSGAIGSDALSPVEANGSNLSTRYAICASPATTAYC